MDARVPCLIYRPSEYQNRATFNNEYPLFSPQLSILTAYRSLHIIYDAALAPNQQFIFDDIMMRQSCRKLQYIRHTGPTIPITTMDDVKLPPRAWQR